MGNVSLKLRAENRSSLIIAVLESSDSGFSSPEQSYLYLADLTA